MSQENVEVIRAIYAAWDARDLDALLELTDPDIEFRTSGYFPDFEPIYRGHQGLRSFWKTDARAMGRVVPHRRGAHR
jgi:ketosteroid isomerase-like protein